MTLYGDKESSKDIDFILNYEDYRVFDEVELEISRKHEAPIAYFIGGWIVGYKLPDDFREKSKRLDFNLRNLEIYLLSLMDLALTKMLAGRQSDKDDLKEFFRNHPEIERSSLGERFSQLKIHKTGEGLAYEGKFISSLDEFFPQD